MRFCFYFEGVRICLLIKRKRSQSSQSPTVNVITHKIRSEPSSHTVRLVWTFPHCEWLWLVTGVNMQMTFSCFATSVSSRYQAHSVAVRPAIKTATFQSELNSSWFGVWSVDLLANQKDREPEVKLWWSLTCKFASLPQFSIPGMHVHAAVQNVSALLVFLNFLLLVFCTEYMSCVIQ